MDKSFKIVAILFLLNASICLAELNKEALINDFMAKAETCLAEVGATASDLDDILKKQPAASMEGKCLRACTMKKLNLLNASGKFDKAVALEGAKKMLQDEPEKMKIAIAMNDACGDIPVSDDHCEAAEQYGKCFKEQAIAHGVPLDEY